MGVKTNAVEKKKNKLRRGIERARFWGGQVSLLNKVVREDLIKKQTFEGI